jgi:hypothetical protein
MTGLQTLRGLIGPVAEYRNGVGSNQNRVYSVMKFCNFSLDGASRTTHVIAIETASIVTIYSACGRTAQNVCGLVLVRCASGVTA